MHSQQKQPSIRQMTEIGAQGDEFPLTLKFKGTMLRTRITRSMLDFSSSVFRIKMRHPAIS